jgi:two-component system CheB/CheR fusion protein
MAAGDKRSGKHQAFPIVGIGASAGGGLSAFKKFFVAMPADSGMAFVLVQHLDPTHESLTAQLLARHTAMPVIEVKDLMPVKVNRVYIIPPNKYLTISDSTLHLSEPVLQRGMRMPIDHFLRSLAEAQREKAIGVILSGTGTDGTLGVRAIKGEGGIALAQSPETAQYDGMPRSAIATGLVDYVGPIEALPDVLVRYNAHAFGAKAPEPTALAREAPDHLRSILSVLQARTKYDFCCYKKGTLLRRIARRMPESIHAMEASGFRALRKPIEVDELVAQMNRLLRLGKPRP